MITAILIVYFRWIFGCDPMTNEGKIGIVSLCVLMTFVEAAVAYAFKKVQEK